MPGTDYSSYSQPVTVEFDMDSAKRIPYLYFGDNLEHTRDCINSGLSAQMLRNRKFAALPQRNGCPMDWEWIGGFCAVPWQNTYTRHYEGYCMKRSHESHDLVITGYGDAVSGIAQNGLYLCDRESYLFTMAAKAFRPMDVRVALLDGDGAVLAEETIRVENPDFESYDWVFTPSAGTEKGRLEITFRGEASLTLGAVSLLPQNNFRGMRPDVIERMKELGIRFLRWPGGNFSGEYHWKDGLLPRDRRAPFQSYLWLETQPHTWGFDFHEINTDDFLHLCEEIGAEPFITINPTWNSPQDSADWVEYCNGDETTPYGALRAKNGRVKPYNVKCWSLGNEFGYGHMEGTNGPLEYARAVRLHAEKMLEVTPDLRLCSSGPYPNAEWAEKAAAALSDVANVVSLHHYAEFPQYIDPEKREEEYYRFVNKPDTEYLPRLQQLRAQLPENVTISYDEWNAWAAWYRMGSITEGMFAAHFLNLMYRVAPEYGVSQICHFESVNEGSMRVYPDRVELMPTGQAISAMRDHCEGRILALMEDVTVTEKNGTITCTLTNRSYREEKSFFLPKTGTLAEGKLLSGEGVVVGSRFAETDLEVMAEGEHYRVTLPAHSIAVIKLAVKRFHFYLGDCHTSLRTGSQ